MLVGACVAGGCGVGDGVGAGATVGTGVAVGSGAAVGASVGVGVGVSPGAWVAAGGDPAVGSGVAAGSAVAVGVAATVVATAGEVCSPPQAARAITADRHSSSTAEALPSPVSLPQINFMALFSAPGAVGSMPWTVYQPGVRFDSAGASGCAPWERRWQKPPTRGEGLSHSPADGGNCPSKATFLPSVVNGWQKGSVLSPGLRPAVRRPVVRTAVSKSGPPAPREGSERRHVR